MVEFSAVVNVNTSGGIPALNLNDGGKATYTSGSGTNTLTFTYVVAAGQNTPDLAARALALNGGTIEDDAGNRVLLSGAAANLPGIQIDTTAPSIRSIVTNPA